MLFGDYDIFCVFHPGEIGVRSQAVSVGCVQEMSGLIGFLDEVSATLVFHYQRHTIFYWFHKNVFDSDFGAFLMLKYTVKGGTNSCK